MGISRDKWHKRRRTGARMNQMRKKRKYELGRPASSTKMGSKRIHLVRTRGGNQKFRALRLDQGNFSWGSESISRKARILGVVYNASNNELVRTNTLVKGCIIQVEATPFRQWYEAHYAMPLSRKKSFGAKKDDDSASKKKVKKKFLLRRKTAKIENAVEEQFISGRLLVKVCSRPGQVGRCDGYILEGKELEFYMRKVKSKKANKL